MGAAQFKGSLVAGNKAPLSFIGRIFGSTEVVP
jgi:hypothetical protein